MAFGAKEAAVTSLFPSYPSTYPKFNAFNKSSSSSVRFHIFLPDSAPSPKFTLCDLPLLSSSQSTRKHAFQFHSALKHVTVEEEVVKPPNTDRRRKLFVLNLPWSYSVADIKKLFGDCGTVEDVEIIKHNDGKNRGFAFVAMASGEEAQAAIEKYDTYELVGRIIRVQFSRRFKKPIGKARESPRPGQTCYKLYMSNLAWKVRSNNLRDFLTSDFNPVSVKVVFNSSSGRSAGYGFVSFATKEEAQSAISLLNGKELLERPILMKFSEKNADSETEEESREQHPQES